MSLVAVDKKPFFSAAYIANNGRERERRHISRGKSAGSIKCAIVFVFTCLKFIKVLKGYLFLPISPAN